MPLHGSLSLVIQTANNRCYLLKVRASSLGSGVFQYLKSPVKGDKNKSLIRVNTSTRLLTGLFKDGSNSNGYQGPPDSAVKHSVAYVALVECLQTNTCCAKLFVVLLSINRVDFIPLHGSLSCSNI